MDDLTVQLIAALLVIAFMIGMAAFLITWFIRKSRGK